MDIMIDDNDTPCDFVIEGLGLASREVAMILHSMSGVFMPIKHMIGNPGVSAILAHNLVAFAEGSAQMIAEHGHDMCYPDHDASSLAKYVALAEKLAAMPNDKATAIYWYCAGFWGKADFDLRRSDCLSNERVAA